MGIAFDEAMLSWPPRAPIASDGCWGPHWYASLWDSTGWAPYVPKEVTIPAHLRELHAACREAYEHLHAYRLQ